MKSAKIREIVLGKALDPLKSETRHSLALVAFLAWVGLGADGLSSSAYGPEETFKACFQISKEVILSGILLLILKSMLQFLLKNVRFWKEDMRLRI